MADASNTTSYFPAGLYSSTNVATSFPRTSNILSVL